MAQLSNDAKAKIRGLVVEAVGASSMHWSNIIGAGVYQSDKAIELAERTINEIIQAAETL